MQLKVGCSGYSVITISMVGWLIIYLFVNWFWACNVPKLIASSGRFVVGEKDTNGPWAGLPSFPFFCHITI